MKAIVLPVALGAILLSSCKKDVVTPTSTTPFSFPTPTTYVFQDANGNSTVDYSGQIARINQLREMVAYMVSGRTNVINAQVLKDMYANTNDNGNGNFSFTAVGKQLKNKCFSLDQNLYELYMDSIAIASQSFAVTASNGVAGVLTSGTSTYLFNKNGLEIQEFIEKGIMGGVFMHQALNEYLGSGKQSVDNTVAVDPAAGKYYTALEHHWDEAFGYFGVDVTYPSVIPTYFWGKYCNVQDPTLGCNKKMMDNFLRGRSAIAYNVLNERTKCIEEIRNTWEDICAYQAMKYMTSAMNYFGTDNAKYLHNLSEAYGMVWALRYAPESTRNISQSEHAALMAMFGQNFWNLTINDLAAIKNAIDAKY